MGMRTWLLAAVGLLLVAGPGQGEPGTTVDGILARNIQARGGRDRMLAIQTMRVKEKFISGSFHADVVEVDKRPDKVRSEFTLQGLTQVQAYDGHIGWQVSPFEGRKDPDLLSEDDLKGLVESADIDGPLLDYAQKGHRAEWLGVDDVEGTSCDKVKLTLKDGNVQTYFIDRDSAMVIKVEYQSTVRGTVRESEEYLGAYEKVDGVYFPFERESGHKGSDERTTFAVDKIEINVPVDDSQFAMPGGATR